MAALSPVRLLAAAQTYVGFHEENVTGRGQLVARFLTEAHRAGDGEWSAAFIHHCGYWSHYEAAADVSSWPLPIGDCRDIAEYAKERHAVAMEPEAGDIVVHWSRARRQFERARIVLALTAARGQYATGERYVDCRVIEGNSSDRGMAGPSIVLATRHVSVEAGDRIVRWTSLDRRAAIGNPAVPSTLVAGRAELRRAG